MRILVTGGAGYIGSVVTEQPADPSIRDTDPTRPSSPDGETKLAMERALHSATQSAGTSARVVMMMPWWSMSRE